MLRRSSARSLLLEAIYRVYSENVAVTAQTLFSDTILPILEMFLLERHLRI